MVSRQPAPQQLQRGQLRQRNTKLYIFILIGFCLFFFMRYTSRLVEYGKEQLIVAQWEQKIADAKLEQAELLSYRDYVQTDAYVEEISRQELLMARPGDTLVVVLPNENVAPAEASAMGENEGNTMGTSAADSLDSPVVTGSNANSNSTNAQPPIGNETSTGTTVQTIISATPSVPIQEEPVWRQWIYLFSQSQ